MSKIELGSISDLIKDGEDKGLLSVSENRVNYINLQKSYALDPEERIRAALYIRLVKKEYQNIKIEEGYIDIQASDEFGSLKIFECEVTAAAREKGIGELRSRLMDANLKEGFLVYSEGDKLISEIISLTTATEIEKPGDEKPFIISTINLKGGVGKTTLTVALARFLAREFKDYIKKKGVLLIDIDPQSNATELLLNPKQIEEIYQYESGNETSKLTVAQIFKDAINETKEFISDTAIVKLEQNLYLLPSHPEFIELQDKIPNAKAALTFGSARIMEKYISSVLREYDYVLVDCPPNLGIVALNALSISTHYLIPVIPNRLSTWGIPHILGRIHGWLKKEIGRNPELLGIVFNMVSNQSDYHKRSIQRIVNADVPVYKEKINETVYVYQNRIKRGVQVERSSDQQTGTLKQIYGDEYDNYKGVVHETLQRLGVIKA